VERHPTPDETGATPIAIVDGGGEPWERLGAAIQRHMEQLRGGEVLEVISADARARADVPTWCYLAGYDLMWMTVQRDNARFWIRKRGGSSAD
jgi:TusA-related sulfurtransferase